VAGEAQEAIYGEEAAGLLEGQVPLAQVEAIGPGVTNVKAGDRVLLMGRNNWASKKRDKAKALLPVAAELDVLQAAMLKINPATAALMLKNHGNLKRGDWLIQNAANSGVAFAPLPRRRKPDMAPCPPSSRPSENGTTIPLCL